MIALLLQIIVGLIGGVAAAFQAQFSGLMGNRLGELESVFFTYAGGGMVIAVIVLILRGGGNIAAWNSVPWYVYFAGPLGLVIIASLSFTVPRIGPAAAATLFVAAWLIFSAIIDHFGLFGAVQRSINFSRLVGMVILFFGTWLIVR